ncbi:hypothetical protein D3C86_994110 [compost metagenome]
MTGVIEENDIVGLLAQPLAYAKRMRHRGKGRLSFQTDRFESRILEKGEPLPRGLGHHDFDVMPHVKAVSAQVEDKGLNPTGLQSRNNQGNLHQPNSSVRGEGGPAASNSAGARAAPPQPWG